MEEGTTLQFDEQVEEEGESSFTPEKEATIVYKDNGLWKRGRGSCMGPHAAIDATTSLHLRACVMGHSAEWPRVLERGPRGGSMNPDTKLGSAGSSQL